MSKNKIFSFKNLIRYFLVIIFFTQNFYPIFSQDIVIEAQSSGSSSSINQDTVTGSENSSSEKISSSLENSNSENLQSSSMQLSSEIIKSERSDASSTNIVSEISSTNNYDSSQIYSSMGETLTSQSISPNSSSNLSSSDLSSIFSNSNFSSQRSSNENTALITQDIKNEDIKIDDKKIDSTIIFDGQNPVEVKTHESKAIDTDIGISIFVQKDTQISASGENLQTTNLIVENKNLDNKEKNEIKQNFEQKNIEEKNKDIKYFDTKNENIKTQAFEFGIPTQHLKFSKPIKIDIPIEAKDGEKVVINVKHFGEENFSTSGLSVDENSSCQDGEISNPSNEGIVSDGKVSFFTCGASTFTYTYTGGPTATTCGTDPNCADNSTRTYTTNVATGKEFATGATVGDISVEIDMQMFAGTNPKSPGTANCYPKEKSFILKAPDGTQTTLFPAGSYPSSVNNCPRVKLLFTDSGTTTISSTTTTISSGTFKPTTPFSNLKGKSIFGNWQILMGDNTGTDGVIMRGYKINLSDNNNVGPLCISSPNSYSSNFNVSNSIQTKTAQLDYFSLQDEKKAYSGYYTTLSVGDLYFGSNKIDISYKPTGLTTLSGSANPGVVLVPSTTNYITTTGSITFIKRDAGNNSFTGTYGSKLNLKFDIPAYTPVGVYSGVITYTLYEN